MDHIDYTLDNGIDVILQPMATAPVVACNVWVGVGSADEEPREAGLAHVHEHMLFKGTETRGVGEIARDVENAGGRINAFTGFDQTCYYVVLSSRYFDSALDILSDAIRRSSFDADELDRELEVIQEEIKMYEDRPTRVSARMLFETAFEQHPYRNPIIGTSESVASFERSDVVDFFEKHYVPQNLTVVVAGDFEVDDAKDKVERYFGDFDGPDYSSVVRPEEPPQSSMRINVDRREIRQNHLRFGFHIPEVRHDDIPAIDLLSIILGYGDSSHLKRVVQRDAELVNAIFATAYTPREPGLFLVGADFQPHDDRPETAPEAICERVFEEIARFHHVEPTAEELQRAKTLLFSQEVYGKQTIEGLAMKLGRSKMVTGDPDFEKKYHRALRDVDAGDIRRVARRYLTVDNTSVVHLAPDSQPGVDEDDLADAVERANERAAARAVDTAVDTDDAGIARIELPDGPTLVVQPDDSVETFSMRALTLGGVRCETEHTAGLHKLLSKLLTEGTPSRSALEIAGDVEAMAASLKGVSGRNSFGLGMTGLSRYFDRCLDVFADCLLAANVPADEFAREQRQQREKITARNDKLGAVNHDRFARAFYGSHPYSFPVLGTHQTLDSLDAQSARQHLQKRQNPADMVISVVGDVSGERVLQRVERLFQDPEAEPTSPPQIPEFSPPDRPLLTVGDLEKEQAHVIAGFAAPVLTSPQVYALDVLDAVLSGQGGRLFYELRDRQSLAYSVSARRMLGLEATAFAIRIATSPDKIPAAVEGIRTEVRRLRDDTITDRELDRARRYLIGNHDIGLQKNSTRAMKFGLDELYELGYRRALEYGDAIADVTKDDLRELIDQWIDPERMVVSVTKPPSTDVDAGQLGLELIGG